MSLPPDGIDRTPIDAGNIEIPLRRMHHMTIVGLTQGVASFSDPATGEPVAQLTSGHGFGGLNLYLFLEDGGVYEVDIHSIVNRLILEAKAHDLDYDLDAEKERTREQREHPRG